MTVWNIGFHRKAKKVLLALTPSNCEKLTAKIDQLAMDPRPHGCIKLTNFDPEMWRIRVGDYRVLYQILPEQGLIWVVKVEFRAEDTYRQ